MIHQLQKELRALKCPTRIPVYANFFKTGKGQYGEGDKFLGLTMPQQRATAKRYVHLSLEEIQPIFDSEYHEERLTAILILVQKGPTSTVVEFYLKNSKKVNNWDLVDVSADKILGAYLFDKDKSILTNLASSGNLWERRISIIATFYFIKNNQFVETLRIAEKLLHDKHDLIHKAVGWMLREIGKRDLAEEEFFLKTYYKIMPRTMLRYAIEKFPLEKRKYYMNKP
jgi:3-methyladenine DNA glycosylase AlkD